MEQLIKKSVREGFKVEFVEDPLHPGNILIDVRREFKRVTTTVSPEQLAFENVLEISLEQIIETYKDKI